MSHENLIFPKKGGAPAPPGPSPKSATDSLLVQHLLFMIRQQTSFQSVDWNITFVHSRTVCQF